MAIIYNGTTLNGLTYNNTNITEVWVCDTSTASCTKVFPDSVTIPFNYLAVDTDLSSLNRSADATSTYKGCCGFNYTCNDLRLYVCTEGCINVRYNTTLSVTIQDETPVCTGTCGIYDYCIWTSNDLGPACACICAYYKHASVVTPLETCVGCKYSLDPTNKTITSATYSVNTGICACLVTLVTAMCSFCGAGTIISNPSLTRSVFYCATNTVTGETKCSFSSINNEASSTDITFSF